MDEVRTADGRLMALVIRDLLAQRGATHFFTRPEEELQVGVLNRPEGFRVAAHEHRPAGRVVRYTSEALLVLTGLVEVTFSDAGRVERLGQFQACVIFFGLHSVRFIQDSLVWEVKQGPFQDDKVMA